MKSGPPVIPVTPVIRGAGSASFSASSAAPHWMGRGRRRPRRNKAVGVSGAGRGASWRNRRPMAKLAGPAVGAAVPSRRRSVLDVSRGKSRAKRAAVTQRWTVDGGRGRLRVGAVARWRLITATAFVRRAVEAGERKGSRQRRAGNSGQVRSLACQQNMAALSTYNWRAQTGPAGIVDPAVEWVGGWADLIVAGGPPPAAR